MTTDHDLHGYRNEMGPCVCANCEANRKEFAVVTARADTAELMLAGVMLKVNTYSPSQNPGACMLRDVPGLREWMKATGTRLEKIVQLTAERDRLDAERERVAHELAAIIASASPAS